jgi:hypothetical protein
VTRNNTNSEIIKAQSRHKIKGNLEEYFKEYKKNPKLG